MTRQHVLISLVFALFAICTVAFAAEQPAATAPAPSKEMRQQMAAVHEKMAACLRSDKPFNECREEMHKSCQSMMGQGCSMMGMRMHDHMMKQPDTHSAEHK